MRITAKHDGHCTACGSDLRLGDEVEWDRLFGARCLGCAQARRYPDRSNRRGEACAACGLFLPPRAGLLEPVDRGGWKVLCIDRAGCETRVEKREHDRLERVRADAELGQEVEALLAAVRGRPAELAPEVLGATVAVLKAGGWPEGDGRARETLVITSTSGEWLHDYSGERSGEWLALEHRRAARWCRLEPGEAGTLTRRASATIRVRRGAQAPPTV